MAGRVIAPASIAERFDFLLISPELANVITGRLAPGEVSYIESEQSSTRRTLLNVEKTALKNKLDDAKSQANYLNQINQQLHNVIEKKLLQNLSDTKNVSEELLNWSPEVTLLIDVLSTPAATVSKIEGFVARIPWLFEDLQKLVNQPKNRRRDVKGDVIAVDTLKTALSFIGIDNVKRVLPSLIFKQALPLITDPYPQIKHKMWEYAFMCAKVAEILAVERKMNAYTAFTLAMFSQLSRCVIFKLYFKLFEQVHMDFLKHAQKAKLRDLHTALHELQPDPSRMIPLLNTHCEKVSLHLFEFMELERLDYCTPLKQIIEDSETPIHPMTTLLKQSRYYVKYRMLENNKLFLDNESSTFITGSALDSAMIEQLNSQSLTNMPGLAVF